MRGLRENCRWRPSHLRVAGQVGPTEQTGNCQVHLEEGVDLYDSSRPVLGWFLTGLFTNLSKRPWNVDQTK